MKWFLEQFYVRNFLLFCALCVATSKCAVCPAGRFGSDCAGVCHCNEGDSACNPSSGSCAVGTCSRGWRGFPTCQEECAVGFFGINCDLLCHCPAGDKCNVVNGLCENGQCAYGWAGPGCQIRLPVFVNPPKVGKLTETSVTLTWGPWSSNYDIGDPTVAAYVVQYNAEGTLEWHDSTTVHHKPPKLTYYVTLKLAKQTRYRFRLVILWENDGKLMQSIPSPATGYYLIEKEAFNMDDDNLNNTTVVPFNESLNFDFGDNSTSHNISFHTAAVKTSGNEGLSGGVVAAIIIVIIVFAAVACAMIIFIRKKLEEEDRAKIFESELHERSVDRKPQLYFESPWAAELTRRNSSNLGLSMRSFGASLNTSSTYLLPEGVQGERTVQMISSKSCPVRVSQLAEVCTAGIQDPSWLIDEFRLLRNKNTPDGSVGKKRENITKNSSQVVIPFDSNRVKVNSFIGNDYINASYVRGYPRSRWYIVTQAPLKDTVTEFWRMVWENHTNLVVMLMIQAETNKEGPLHERYWPESGAMECGPFQIEMCGFKSHKHYSVRKMTIAHGRHEQVRHLTHYQYRAWTTSNIPRDIGSFVKFVQAIKQNDAQQSGPALIHCLHGTGRSGLFIAIDSLLEQGKEREEVDVLRFVNKLRSDRVKLVHTLEQYRCIYQSLTEAFRKSLKQDGENTEEDVSSLTIEMAPPVEPVVQNTRSAAELGQTLQSNNGNNERGRRSAFTAVARRDGISQTQNRVISSTQSFTGVIPNVSVVEGVLGDAMHQVRIGNHHQDNNEECTTVQPVSFRQSPRLSNMHMDNDGWVC